MVDQATIGLFEQIAFETQQDSTLAMSRCSLLDAVARRIGADSASAFDAPWEPDLAADRKRIASWGISEAYLNLWVEHRQRWGESMRKLVTAIRTGPVVDAEVYETRERSRLAIYREAFYPQGTTSILGSFVRYRGRTLAVMCFKRHGRARPFGARDVTLLSSLLPAIGLADAGFQFALEAIARPLDHGGTVALSPREDQVARLACKGMQNNEIAALLGTSAETVKKQVRSVMGKMDVSNRTELAMVWATRSRM
jgi:DNA-binding CsgD family transcriptional regulator